MFICVALLVSIPYKNISQETQSSESELLTDAYAFLNNKNFEKAIEKANLASKQFVKNENWEGLIKCQDVLIDIEYSGEYPKSIIQHLKHNLSFIPQKFEADRAYSIFNLGYIEDERGNLIKAISYYEKCITPYKRLKMWEQLSDAYENIGILYIRIGDYFRAEKYIRACIRTQLQNIDSLGYSESIFNLAENAFFKEDYAESEKLYLEYLNLQDQYKEDAYYELCRLKLKQNEVILANEYFLKAKKFNSNDYYSEADFNSLYAEILCKQGNINDAIKILNKNETEIAASENKRNKGKYFYNLADLFSKKKDWQAALLNYNKSLEVLTNQEISVKNISGFAHKKYFYNEIGIGNILIGLSKVYHEKFIENKKEEYRSKAKESINYSLEALDYKRSFFEDIESSIFANKKSKELYETAIDIYLDWYEESENKEYLEAAFQIAQRHNAFILRQQINERVTLDKYEVSDRLKKQYLNQKLNVHETSYALENDYSQSGFEKLKREEEKLDSLTKIINEKHPSFNNSKNDFEVTSSQQIQKHLKKDKAVIKYFEGSEKLYSFVITKDKLTYFVHDNIKEIKQQIGSIRSTLSNFEYSNKNAESIEKEFLDESHQLYNNILFDEIESLPKQVKSLVVIPTGSLTQIPFEALLSEKKESWNDPAHYLINDYAISYNYFCKALTSPTINKELNKVLSYGLKYDEYTLNASKKLSNDSLSDQIIEKFRSEELGHLYFADVEANEVAKMFNGVSFLNEKATKKSFLSNVLDYDIIHLSAHSFVDYQYPSNSSIIFSKKDSLTDNLLQIKDVDRLSLDGQLFTLSACNTFFGKKNEGEGLSSMARSFIQSGAGSVVGSFWSVPDEISKSFMIRFYSKLKEGMGKDEALRATKIDFMTDDNLSSPLYRSPAYWSAWVIYGDTQSIYKSNSGLLYFGIGLFLLSILLLIKYKSSF